MTTPAAPPALPTTTVEFALTVGTFRHVTVAVDDATRLDYVLATDVCHLLGLTGLVHAVTATLTAETKAYLRVLENGVTVTRLALTLDGLRQLAAQRERLGGDVGRASRLVAQVERLVRRSHSRRPAGASATRWGWQPIRRMVRAHGFSARSFLEAANALPLPDVDPVTPANYAAWSYGGCLPQESLVIRASTLLNVTPEELFNPAVLAAMPNRGRGRRQPVALSESASGPQPAPAAAPEPR